MSIDASVVPDDETDQEGFEIGAAFAQAWLERLRRGEGRPDDLLAVAQLLWDTEPRIKGFLAAVQQTVITLWTAFAEASVSHQRTAALAGVLVQEQKLLKASTQPGVEKTIRFIYDSAGLVDGAVLVAIPTLESPKD